MRLACHNTSKDRTQRRVDGNPHCACGLAGAMLISVADVLEAIISIKTRLTAVQRNSKTAAHICEVVTALEPILRSLEGNPDLQESHIQTGLSDLKVFIDSELDSLSRELEEQWEITRFVCATGNEDRMKSALERLNSSLTYLDMAMTEAYQKVR